MLSIYTFDQQLNQDFVLLFGVETASKMLEKWETTFKPKVIKEAKHLTQSAKLSRLLKAAEKQAEDDDNCKIINVIQFYFFVHSNLIIMTCFTSLSS